MADILVIEDNLMLQKTYRRLLRNHNLKMVTSGLEALQNLEEGKFDLIVSDGDLEGSLSGIDVWKWVSINRADLATRFVFCSANMEVERFCEKSEIPYHDKSDSKVLASIIKTLLGEQQ